MNGSSTNEVVVASDPAQPPAPAHEGNGAAPEAARAAVLAPAPDARLPAGRQPVSEQRRQIFLEVLSRTGSLAAAAAASTPWARGKRCGYESFRDLAKRDPEFALALEEARAAALGRAEEALSKRAIDGIERPIFQAGRLVGTEKVYSDNLLLRLCQRLDPDAWTDRQKTELSGRVEHTVAGAMLAISASDVMLLDEPDQHTLVELVRKIGDRKSGAKLPGVPAGAEAAER